MTTNPTCETCQAWHQSEFDIEYSKGDGVTAIGTCRINAPGSKHTQGGNALAVWPTTDSTDHCGQHIPIETECEHKYGLNGPWIQCTECGAHHPSANTPKDLGMEDIPSIDAQPSHTQEIGPPYMPHVDDHSPEAKLKDACEKLGKANDRIAELEAMNAAAVESVRLAMRVSEGMDDGTNDGAFIDSLVVKIDFMRDALRGRPVPGYEKV